MKYQLSTLALALLTLTVPPIGTESPKEDRPAAMPATGFAASVTIGDSEIFIGRTGGGSPDRSIRHRAVSIFSSETHRAAGPTPNTSLVSTSTCTTAAVRLWLWTATHFL